MSKMKDIFVSLVLNKHNLQIVHWNCFGVDFDPAHEKLAKYVEQLDTYIDEVAEMLKMCGEAPLSFTECVEYAQSSNVAYIVLPNTDYCTRAIWENCKLIFTSLIDLYSSINDSDYPRDVVSKLDEHCYWFRLEGVYKGVARLKEVNCEHDTATEDQAPPEDLPSQKEAEEIPTPPSTPEYEDDLEKEVLHDDDADDDNDTSDDYEDVDAPEPYNDGWDDDIIPDDDI